MNSPNQLDRFVRAQDRGESYARALTEVKRGRKESHWIWYVFPQIAGLGSSALSQEFSIDSLEEAREYLAHPVLGPRLLEITAAANSHSARSAAEIFGPDDVKFRSSMTLFMRADPTQPLFEEALRLFFDGEPDARTDALLSAG